MDWTQFTIFIVSILGMFFWNRSESRSDIRHMDGKLEANRNLTAAIHQDAQARHQEARALIEAWRLETKDLIQAIQLDMKDFHGKLLSLEERRK